MSKSFVQCQYKKYADFKGDGGANKTRSTQYIGTLIFQNINNKKRCDTQHHHCGSDAARLLRACDTHLVREIKKLELGQKLNKIFIEHDVSRASSPRNQMHAGP